MNAEDRDAHFVALERIAEAVVYDDRGREVGRGNGIFVRSRIPLQDARGYGVGEPG